MAISNDQLSQLTFLQQLVNTYTGVLQKEASIVEADRQISSGNVTLFNTLISDVLNAMADIING